MLRKKGIHPSAGAESKPKSRIPSLFRNLLGKPNDDAAGALQGNSGKPLPAGRGEPIHPSLSNPSVGGIPLTMRSDALASQSSTNRPQHASPLSSIEPFFTGQTAAFHHSSSSPPALGSSSAASHTSSAHQRPAAVSVHVPTLRTELLASTDASDLRTSSQKLPTNISIPSTGNQKERYSNRFSSQLAPAAIAPESTDSESRTFTKGLIASLRILGAIVGVPTESMEEGMSTNGSVGDHCSFLAKFVKDLMKFNISQAMRSSLESLHSEFARMAMEINHDVENARWEVTNRLQLFLLENIVTGGISSDAFEKMEKHVSDILDKVNEDALRQSFMVLPCANSAAYNDYTDETNTRKRVSCFKGTRQALLKEVITWLGEPNSNVYVLFGLAGIGKSTIAQTVAEITDKIHLLGASFFFSRDGEDRRSAKMLFTTIASQLCVYNPEFAKAIEGILSTEKGKSTIRKRPLEQLETLILEPLRRLTPRKVVVVIDALDECNDEDAPAVLMGLIKLVQSLPSFKVILTTRPQPHIQLLLDGQTAQRIFHLHNIEEKVVDGDIELYLRHNLAWEQVRIRLPTLMNPWAASDEDIQLLVRAAGRLFIIASTAVLFLLDKTSTPKIRMAKLRTALGQNHTPFKTLNDFYTTILRSAVPNGCERDTVNLYQTVVGSIILVQQPLSIHALATLANIEADVIAVVLGNLQPVILLGSNYIPLVYHKSFSDYIQDIERCRDEDLYIDTRFHHTQMAIRCLRLLNQCLRQNILDLDAPARFMDNIDALKFQGFPEHHAQERIPAELQYTCLYFANHIKGAIVEDTDLMEVLEQFLNERLLNWLEALSWIGKLDSAHHALLTLQQQLKRSSPDLCQLATDVLRFVSKFYDLIRQSALHTYHSALPFTPTETSLYKIYSKQMSFCRVLGGQKMWDGLVTDQNVNSGNRVWDIIFSPNSSLFACFMHGLVTIHDAVSGIPLGRIEGQVLSISGDFSKAAAFDDGSIILYNVKGVTPVTSIKPSATVVKIALSPNGSRLLAWLDNDTVSLWDTEKCEQIENLGSWERKSEICYSSDNSRAAFASGDVVKLLDGMSGKIITDLTFPGIEWPALMFSGDGSRLACLDSTSLKVWNGRDGALIGSAEEVAYTMTISACGSRLVTGKQRRLKLWSGNNLALLKTFNLDFEIESLAIHNDWIGIASRRNGLVALYDINSQAFVVRLPFLYATALAFSSDCKRLAAGTYYGRMQLLDIPSITASNIASQKPSSYPTALAFSADCSRCASGHHGGTIRLWDTSNMAQLATHKRHSTGVTAIAFSVDGGVFASVDEDGVIQLWNDDDGEPSGVLNCSGEATAVALSNSILAAATEASITLWDLNSRSTVATLHQHNTHLLAFSHDLSLLATVNECGLMLWDTEEYQLITTFNFTDASESDSEAWSMKFLPDNSQLAVQLANANFYSLNAFAGITISENQGIGRLYPSWHGILVQIREGNVVGRFPQLETDMTVLNCPSGLRVKTESEGLSIIALGCADGSILLIKPV